MKYRNFSAIIFSLGASLLLAACGGGGKGFVKPTLNFSSFSDIKANQEVIADGISQTATETKDASTGEVTSISPATQDTDNTNLTFDYDASRALSALTLESAEANLSWSEASGDIFFIPDVSLFLSNSALFVSNPDSTQTFVIANPDDTSLSWNYQTFGVWQDISVSDTTITTQRGVVSVGRASPAFGIPTEDGATYEGLASGFYTDADGKLLLFDSALTAEANFAARSISFTTSGTTAINDNPVGITSRDDLNLTGNLFYNAGSNQFTGTLTNNGSLSGTATGRFYGSNAEEIGGTFDLNGSGLESMLGGFGAKEIPLP
ncbi:transferrin-binding protein-like solute binding protein [Amphritea sp. HPY]|uniref:transferrin-binding protein-like solute binding protein n=1 Tax=Amphritea sp. HPY TaxID=3421652 RepID=UPI003D7E2AD7